MEATKYLTALMKLCENEGEENGCVECPLKKFGCGVPQEKTEIEQIIAAVEQYKKKPNLKPCPYCGGEGGIKESPVFHNTGEDSTKHTIGKSYSVRCADCGAGTESFEKVSQAKKAWNQRCTK